MINFLIRFVKLIKNKLICEIRNFYQNYFKRLGFQEKMYSKNNLDRTQGIKLINKILRKQNLKIYDEGNGMYSEHLIMFASIAFQSKTKINSILEIGTFDGITSILLSNLFPNSEIITIDLKDDDPIFKSIYERKDDKLRKKFILERNNRLSKFKNIKFIQFNSLKLTLNSLPNKKFDLIWIDGAHGYPIVCSDITNAISLANNNTILMCDDIWKNLKNSDPIYSSVAAYETLEAFNRAGIIKSDYFYKRLGKKYLSSEKFISLSRLTI